MSANRLWLACLLAMAPVMTPAQTAFDAVKAFGALESVRDLNLSPDGTRVAYVAPTGGAGTAMCASWASIPRAAPSAARRLEQSTIYIAYPAPLKRITRDRHAPWRSNRAGC